MVTDARQTVAGAGLLLLSSGLCLASGIIDLSVLLAAVAVAGAIAAGVEAVTRRDHA
jgi:hypothetical protein